jgi:hypothetical protein
MSDYDGEHHWPELDEPIPDDLSSLGLDPSCVRWNTLADPGMAALEAAGEQQGLGGLPTGFIALDDMLQGLRPGQLIVVGGLTGAGKSVLLGDFFRAWMNLKVPSALVTLEMTRDEVWLRQAAAACTIDHKRLKAGDLGDSDWSKLARWVGATDDAPSWVCDKPRMTLAEIDALTMTGVAEHGWQSLIVDYAQIVRHKAGTREREVAEIAAGLKEIGRQGKKSPSWSVRSSTGRRTSAPVVCQRCRTCESLRRSSTRQTLRSSCTAPTTTTRTRPAAVRPTYTSRRTAAGRRASSPSPRRCSSSGSRSSTSTSSRHASPATSRTPAMSGPNVPPAQ